MRFFQVKQSFNGLRIGVLVTPHGAIRTPVFAPCATVAAIKTITPDEARKVGTRLVLANSYHLHLRPGEKLIKKFGGLHKFMGWNGPILTDSGGFQVFSLGRNRGLVKIKNDGVEFTSHLDGSRHFLTPEKVIQIQLDLGTDILMPLDVCPPGEASRKEVEQAVERTLEWAKISLKYFRGRAKNSQLLFGIVQGGTDQELRKYCATRLQEISDKDGWDGYAVGGLAVGEDKVDMWKIVRQMNEILPENKPRYLMGVGEPRDLIQAIGLGMDMFDCVLPTRLARHGVVWTKISNLKSQISKLDLRKAKFKTDKNPIQSDCSCPACQQNFSRAYLHHLVRIKEILGIRLLTLHNLYFINNLIQELKTKTML